jgi:uncharacterized protein (DUF1697 family)
MRQYVAFLRGINVGGNNLIKMAELQLCLSATGLSDVQTYIQSGNIIFRSTITDKAALAEHLEKAIKQTFGLGVAIAVFSAEEWRHIIAAAPAWWGADETWRHNILILVKPGKAQDIVNAIGELKPGVETLQAGAGVIYQSIDRNAISRGATGSKLIANAVYRQISIRNYNTARKLADLLEPS